MSDSLDRISEPVRNIKSSEYLYNIEPCHFSNLTYKGALKEKIRLGKILLRELNEKSFDLSGSAYMDNEVRLLKVSDAIEFNKFLLNELDNCKE